MSAHDSIFIHIENAINPMHIGNVSVFEGPAPTYGDLVRTVAANLPLVPRYRQRVRFVPLELGRPVWVDDAHFQILYHIRHTAVPQPGSSEQLRNLAGRVFAANLDRSRPLWERGMGEGLEGGRWALISKVHHCMVDGVSATDLLTVLLDREPQPTPTRAPAWHPQDEPSGLHLLADTLADAVLDPIDRIRGLPLLARANLAAGFSLTDLRNLAASYRTGLRPQAGELNGPIGPHRPWSWASAGLHAGEEIRSALGGTVD